MGFRDLSGEQIKERTMKFGLKLSESEAVLRQFNRKNPLRLIDLDTSSAYGFVAKNPVTGRYRKYKMNIADGYVRFTLYDYWDGYSGKYVFLGEPAIRPDGTVPSGTSDDYLYKGTKYPGE